MNTKMMYAAALGCAVTAGSLAHAEGLAEATNTNGQTTNTQAGERIDVDAAIAAARLIGVGDQAELVIPLPMTEDARRRGAKSRQYTIKGVCGPDGALSSPEVLLAHARRDLEQLNNPRRGSASVTFGESPKFVVTYDPQDTTLVTLFLPSFQAACEYVDSQLDDRTEIRIDLETDDIPGTVIGSAGSATETYGYETYRQGLQAADNRIPEESNFADSLPSGSLPVWYDGSTTTTQEMDVTVNESQIRAIYGENSFSQRNAISITLDNTADWDYFVYTDDQVNSGELSLVDVAVHEITHGLGFRSRIAAGGNNSSNNLAGLDVARFKVQPPAYNFGNVGGVPVAVAQFTVFPRNGDNLPFTNLNYYSRVNAGNAVEFIELEGGDLNASATSFLQPSHLAYYPNFGDKIGLMDPVINNGTTFGPGYWGPGEVGPLNDMGWKPIRASDVIGDCNGNGVLDIIDIGNGFRDADGDLRLDVCETFYDDISPAGHFVSKSTQTVYDAAGITSLFDFIPGSATVFARNTVTTLDVDYTAGDADTVRVFSGVIFAPQADEYAFRIEHEHDAQLEIAGQQFFRSGLGNILNPGDGFEIVNPSLPVYIQLEAGWHAFEFTTLIVEAGPIRLSREARSLGGWGPIPADNLGGTFFEDCDGNGNDDTLDPDSDGDGIPDACEEPDCDNDGVPDDQELDCDGNGVPDDCEPRGDFVNVFDAGIAGTDAETIEYGTCNSPDGFQFDTEMAIWDSNGDLVATNDDTLDPCNTNRLSRLDLQLPAGDYFIGITGYDMLFSDNFGVEPGPGTTCSEGGAYFLTVGTVATVIADVDPGKVKVFKFTIVEAPTCPADLSAPFGTLNFFDVSAFITLYNVNSPLADFAAPFGTLNFFDVSAFITAYNAGCP